MVRFPFGQQSFGDQPCGAMALGAGEMVGPPAARLRHVDIVGAIVGEKQCIRRAGRSRPRPLRRCAGRVWSRPVARDVAAVEFGQEGVAAARRSRSCGARNWSARRPAHPFAAAPAEDGSDRPIGGLAMSVQRSCHRRISSRPAGMAVGPVVDRFAEERARVDVEVHTVQVDFGKQRAHAPAHRSRCRSSVPAAIPTSTLPISKITAWGRASSTCFRTVSRQSV